MYYVSVVLHNGEFFRLNFNFFMSVYCEIFLIYHYTISLV